jgi:hypothetical protein
VLLWQKVVTVPFPFCFALNFHVLVQLKHMVNAVQALMLALHKYQPSGTEYNVHPFPVSELRGWEQQYNHHTLLGSLLSCDDWVREAWKD